MTSHRDIDADPKEIVRRGYDAVSLHYRADDADPETHRPWVAELTERLPRHASVLDLGCGNGVPVARDLAAAGFAVIGVDLSEVQVTRARALVPDATFLAADATTVELPERSFHAVVCLYALIHIPLEEQPPLLARIAGWLRPSGLLVATTGHQAWTGTEDDWLGGGATMWWSHANAATYRVWIEAAGFAVEREEFVPEGDSGHTLFWARVPG
ncbi:class I SAM-dependent methyltransferase [Jiangella mangrovi]|uniref:2-polyprenyl-3-methyl-5-hydroxy-6-metoxy-1, 4-benzoquinol methylase n=1 Tax=Jiangella mangrovi TaxID=1524084 RepID=A0A7W9GX41_9ACTN|nr:class I SAM-dependent methyltransferase [Jiangella mangrovi]MBB5791587.1 2-polyprenyl-3-methyl-5-hydroxy-6-metoxy-1,4-benzoquinol methylase [Jiangella mangrovi]